MSRTALIVLNILLLMVIVFDYLQDARTAGVAPPDRTAEQTPPSSNAPTPPREDVSASPVVAAAPQPMATDLQAIGITPLSPARTAAPGNISPAGEGPGAVAADPLPGEEPTVIETAGGPDPSTGVALASATFLVPPARAAASVAGSDVRRAQTLLARLGYHPGPADGIAGRRTRQAVSAFQAQSGLTADGGIDGVLLSRLEHAATRTPTPGTTMGRIPAPPATSVHTAGGTLPAWLGSLAGGFQRLLGHRHNSVTDGRALHGYCRANSDTWIFDEGRDRLLFCGDVARAPYQPALEQASR